MSKKILYFLMAVLIIFIIVAVFLFKNSKPVQTESYLQTIHGNVSLIVVDTPETRETGLSGRDSLATGTAMFFVFDKPEKYGFWMKDMKFPIDIIWIDENFKIVDMKYNIPPETYPEVFLPREKALYVLETAPYFASENQLKVGEKLNIVLIK